MDAIEAVMTTRAIRRFTDAPVGDDDIWTCLRAARQAPSGGNIQPQQYVVVRDREGKARLDPSGSFGRARRKPVEVVTHWDRFGNRRR